jgi:hypothetical protein
VHSKSYESRKAKMSYNLEWRKYFAVYLFDVINIDNIFHKFGQNSLTKERTRIASRTEVVTSNRQNNTLLKLLLL